MANGSKSGVEENASCEEKMGKDYSCILKYIYNKSNTVHKTSED